MKDDTSFDNVSRNNEISGDDSVLEKKELQSDTRSDKIFTIPNIISMFRIALIPVIVYTYAFRHMYVLSLVLLGISAFSDIIDGIIARKFNMTSELGKLLDPVGDKFTQGALMLCLIFRFWYMSILIGAFIIREIVMIVYGTLLKLRTSHFSSAKWFGKANTVILEGSVLFLIVFGPVIPSPAIDIIAIILTSLSLVTVVVSLILYIIYYNRIFKQLSEEKAAAIAACVDEEGELLKNGTESD